MIHECDARFLLCPLPVLKAQKRLSRMVSGEQLKIQGTSDDGIEEFKLFCSGCDVATFISGTEDNDVWTVIVEKV